MARYCLRKAALRVFSFQSTSIHARSRPLSTLSAFNSRHVVSRTISSPLQRRWASEDATQSEPVADRETEAQHGDNSIAKSSEASKSEDFPIESSDAGDSASVTEAVTSAANPATYKAAEGAAESGGAGNSATYHVTEATAAQAASTAASNITGAPLNETSSGTRPQKEVTPCLYVGNLFFDVKEPDLKREFSKAGNVLSTKIIYDQRGLSKGWVNAIQHWITAFCALLTQLTQIWVRKF